MLRNLCLLGLLLASSTLAAFAQEEERFPAADVKADLHYLYSALQEAHYDLYAFVPKATYDQAFAAALAAIGPDSLTRLETVKLFQRFTALGKVGHSEIDFPASSYIAYAMQGGSLFPLELAFEEGRAYIRKNFSDRPELSAGAEVLSIDGRSMDEIKAAIHPYLSAERPYLADAKLEFWSFPRMHWLVWGNPAGGSPAESPQKQFSITIRGTDGLPVTYGADPISVIAFETKREGEILNTRRYLTYRNQVAYLNPGPFSSTDPREGEAGYRAFIDSAFADIKAKNSRQLILDLRNNSGGHNAYSDYLIAYLADKPFGWYSSFQLKTSAVLKEQTRKQGPEGELDAYSRAILAHADGAVFPYELPLQEARPAGERFTGKVYVLINRQTYSMAAVSAALLQDYGFATLVGEETGDVPTLYASQFSFSLPKTGVVVKVPKGYMVRPNGDEKLSGVVPELQIIDHLLDEEDEILTYTLEHLLKQGN